MGTPVPTTHALTPRSRKPGRRGRVGGCMVSNFATDGRSARVHSQYDIAVVTVAPNTVDTPNVVANQGVRMLMITRRTAAAVHTVPWMNAMRFGAVSSARRPASSSVSAAEVNQKYPHTMATGMAIVE